MTALPDWPIASDAELACAATAGDRAAFAAIYDRYADRLHDFCIGMVRDRDAAADCVQEVFCTVADRLSQLKDADKLRPWLYAIARNEALRHIRQRDRERVFDQVPEAVSAEPGPDAIAARTELADLVAEAAGGLSDRDRSVLELAYRHGLDGPELAEALGVSHASAKKLTQRLRETIERSLGALLVSRRVRNNTFGCAELAAILDGWDGNFTVLMRKRIARHIESCLACDEERRRLFNPVALLGAAPAFIPAPDWLREHTLTRIQLTGTAAASTSPGTSADARGDESGRRRILVAVALLAAVVTAIGVTIAWLHEREARMTPVNLTETAPSPTSAAPRTAVPPSSNPPPVPPTERSVAPSAPVTVTATPPAAPVTPTSPVAPPPPTVRTPPPRPTSVVTPTTPAATPKPAPAPPPQEPATPVTPPKPPLTQQPHTPVTKNPPTTVVIE